MMWQEIMEMALTNGIWSALFVGLLVYELRDSGKRERKYQETIQKLNTHLEIVNDIKEEVKELRDVVINKKSGKKNV